MFYKQPKELNCEVPGKGYLRLFAASFDCFNVNYAFLDASLPPNKEQKVYSLAELWRMPLVLMELLDRIRV